MPLILGTNSIKDTGYDVANSLRFNDGDSANLSRTQVSGNRQTFTFSTWVKRSTLGTDQMLFNAGSSTDFRTMLRFGDADVLQFFNNDSTGGGVNMNLKTNRLFRDVSAWYHIVLRFDPTQSTESHRIRLYVNGSEETSFSTATYPSQNADNTQFNHGSIPAVKIGGSAYSDADYFDGYMAEVVFCDGSSLDPTSFGEFDEDSPTIWKPIDVTGLTFGNNGFYLDFENSGALGTDVSGEGHNWTANNLAATDQSTDTCTNNFATLNPLTIVAGASLTLSEGNLQFNGTSTDAGAKATFGVSSGKWYWEVKTKLSDDNSSGSDRILVATENVRQITSATDPNSQGIWGIQSRSGSGATLNSFTNGTFSNGNSGSTGFNNGTIIGVALDADNGKLYFHKAGTYTDLSGNTGDPANGTNPTFTGLPTDGTFLFPYFENRPNVTPSSQVNFGGAPSFAISSGNSDANGHGNFEYAVPSGYYALNTKNLAEYG